MLALSLACGTTNSGRQAPARSGHTYRVKAGDNLYRIAKRWGVSPESLAALNRIDDPTTLQVGQTLLIPQGGVRPKEEPKPGDEDDEPTRDPLERPMPPPVGECASVLRSEEVPSGDKLIWPVDGVVISKFGQREGARHEGIDIAAPVGTPIWAAGSGRVIFAGEQPGYGLIVVLRHTDRDAVTVYAHNARNCVGEGTEVKVGDVVGLVGNSGGFASPAVHFEVRLGKNTVNPRRMLP